MRYEEALAWLGEHYNLEAQRVTRADAPDLRRIEDLLLVMGDPQTAVPFLHVTGTNGKGSTARIIAALLGAAGLRVGGYASPHIERINERITADNVPLDDDEFAAAVALVANVEDFVVERVGERPSYFEVMAAAAYGWFADAGLAAAVVEVGLGGRYDATNVGDGAVAVVTNVGMDHAEWIGPERSDIATEKAGIVKDGAHLVLGETDPDIVPIFLARPAGEVWLRGVDFDCEDNVLAVGGRALTLRTPGGRYEDVFLPLHGSHQGENAALAVAAVEAFVGAPLGEDVVAEALAGVTAPGRFEVMGRHPLTVLDGAHNAEGARVAATTLREGFMGDGGRRVLVFGCNQPHDPAELLEGLDGIEPDLAVATAADWARAVPVDEVAAAMAARGWSTEVQATVPRAIDRAVEAAGDDGTLLITGSLYVVGEARTHLRT